MLLKGLGPASKYSSTGPCLNPLHSFLLITSLSCFCSFHCDHHQQQKINAPTNILKNCFNIAFSLLEGLKVLSKKKNVAMEIFRILYGKLKIIQKALREWPLVVAIQN